MNAAASTSDRVHVQPGPKMKPWGFTVSPALRSRSDPCQLLDYECLGMQRVVRSSAFAQTRTFHICACACAPGLAKPQTQNRNLDCRPTSQNPPCNKQFLPSHTPPSRRLQTFKFRSPSRGLRNFESKQLASLIAGFA